MGGEECERVWERERARAREKEKGARKGRMNERERKMRRNNLTPLIVGWW